MSVPFPTYNPMSFNPFSWTPRRLPDSRTHKKKKKKGSYSRYTKRVLNSLYPDISMAISSTALAVMDSFFVDIFQRIAREASDLCLRANRKTLKVEDLRAATRLVLNGDIAKFAVEEGNKALAKFNESYLSRRVAAINLSADPRRFFFN